MRVGFFLLVMCYHATCHVSIGGMQGLLTSRRRCILSSGVFPTSSGQGLAWQCSSGASSTIGSCSGHSGRMAIPKQARTEGLGYRTSSCREAMLRLPPLGLLRRESSRGIIVLLTLWWRRRWRVARGADGRQYLRRRSLLSPQCVKHSQPASTTSQSVSLPPICRKQAACLREAISMDLYLHCVRTEAAYGCLSILSSVFRGCLRRGSRQPGTPPQQPNRRSHHRWPSHCGRGSLRRPPLRRLQDNCEWSL